MHDIFLLNDLILECLSHLHGQRNTLNAVARTCRAFHGPALSVLWSKLDSIVPLLLLLGIPHPTQDHTTLIFSTRPGPNEFAIFNKYAKLVHQLTYEQGATYRGMPVTFDISVIHTIGLCRPPLQPLLPNLSRLYIRTSEENHPLEALLWFGPSVQELKINLEDIGQVSSGLLLQEIPARCPELKSLTISSKAEAPDEGIAPCLGRLSRLEEVVLPPDFVNAGSLRVLAQAERLRKLIVRGDPSLTHQHSAFVTHATSSSKTVPYFPSLAHLSLMSPLTSINNLLNHPGLLSHLQALEVISSNDSDLAQFMEFSRTFADYQTNTIGMSLTTIRLDLYDQSSLDGTRLTYEHLLPFLDHDITHFFIRHQLPFSTWGFQWSKLLEAWPNLLELSICADPQRTFSDGVSSTGTGFPFAILYTIAAHNPQIQDLGLYFDQSSPIEPFVAPRASKLKDLKRLVVGNSQGPSDTFNVALALSELCNSELAIEVGEHKMEPYQKTWHGDDHAKDVWEIVRGRFKAMAKMRDRWRAEDWYDRFDNMKPRAEKQGHGF